ncbi:uncharacterized protein B0H64DRAFT_444018 [Chaetomium fimeti]|uniref:GPI anchored serine-threonine rich protein n=1 Tax=Chaetomium fimeti TaxID=1854472 RepID=A0AAE0LRC3_9PEZI|nr:hypothetical protein B0H64DRAFT_444018 [Chaetomium fimeti]
MKFFLLPLAVMASSVMAQATTACGADYIVESCLSSETAKLDDCGAEDWGCRCTQWKSIVTCYNNCPNDPRKNTSDGQRQIFCGYASQYPSNEPTQAATQTGSTPAQNTQDAAGQGDSTDGDSISATTSSSGPADTNSAASLALNAGGVLAAVAGVFAVVM